MAGFATWTDLQAALDAQTLLYRYFRKTWASPGNNQFGSAWTVAGYPAAGANPAGTPGTSYSNDAGGICFPDTSPVRKFIVGCTYQQDLNNNAAAVMWLVDRLVGVSGISLASTGDKTVSSVALPRYTDGIGVLAFLEVTTATTVTAPVVSINSYTDQDGNTAQAGATITFPAAATPIGTCVGPFPLAAGDTGMKAVATVNVATAATVGVANLILVKPLLCIGANPPGPFERLSPIPFGDMPRVFDGAVLMPLLRQFGGGASGIVEVTTVLG